jgi:hypothetical protein
VSGVHAAAIVNALHSEDPPLRLVPADAVERIDRRLRLLAAELEAWRSLGGATSIDHN